MTLRRTALRRLTPRLMLPPPPSPTDRTSLPARNGLLGVGWWVLGVGCWRNVVAVVGTDHVSVRHKAGISRAMPSKSQKINKGMIFIYCNFERSDSTTTRTWHSGQTGRL